MTTEERALTCTTKRISARELPHACEELGQSTSEKGHADDNVGGFDTASLNVDEGEYECRRGEGEQAATHVKRLC